MEQNWSCGFMQKHVVTLDLAKKLHLAGWTKKVEFYWFTDEGMAPAWSLGRVAEELVMCPAPMATELLSEFVPGDLTLTFFKDGCVAALVSGESIKKYRCIDALAELWLIKKEKSANAKA